MDRVFPILFIIFVKEHSFSMPDVLSKEERSVRMSRIHSASTRPELKLRHSLWHLGFRYRINDKSLPGRPDIVLPKFRTVVFMHGCFWHGHKGCPTSHIPKTNTEFWMAKVARNQERDQEVWRKLEAKGWSVIIVWECQMKKKAVLEDTINRVADEIRHNGEILRCAQRERKKAREEYRLERRIRKEREQSLLEEVKSL